jgi:hypothetical protein
MPLLSTAVVDSAKAAFSARDEYVASSEISQNIVVPEFWGAISTCPESERTIVKINKDRANSGS